MEQFPALAMVAEVVVRAEGGPSGMRRPMPSAQRMRGDPNMEQFRTLATSRSNGAAPLFPTLLDAEPLRIRAYPRETVVAEKVEAMVHLGIANSRMKDFFDKPPPS